MRGLRFAASVALASLPLLVIPSAFAANPGLVISEILANPNGSDSNKEYVALLTTEDIDFAVNPYSVLAANNGTASAAGWTNTTSGVIYGFSLTSGTITKGSVIYVGGNALSTQLTSTPTYTYTKNTDGAGDTYGAGSTSGVFGNGGSNADAIGVFQGVASSLTSSSVPVDAFFYGTAPGTAVVSNGTAGYTLPTNDLYSGGFFNASSYIGSDPGADLRLTLNGTFDTSTGSFVGQRTLTTSTSPSAPNVSGIQLTSAVVPEANTVALAGFALPLLGGMVAMRRRK